MTKSIINKTNNKENKTDTATLLKVPARNTANVITVSEIIIKSSLSDKVKTICPPFDVYDKTEVKNVKAKVIEQYITDSGLSFRKRSKTNKTNDITASIALPILVIDGFIVLF